MLKNNQICVSSFATEAECYSFVSNEKITKYKIYPPSQKKSATFLPAMEWNDAENDFVVNISIAKEIRKNHFREIRSILFEKLDKAFMKALEAEDSEKKVYIISLKNEFRKITDIQLPDTEEELLNFIPPIFKEVYDLSI
jgi:hypothetical protein